MGRFISQWPNFMAIMARLSLKRVLQHCSGVQKEFPGYSTSSAGNSSKILVAVPSRKSSFTFPGLHLWGKNSQMEKEKSFLGCANKFTLWAMAFFRKRFKICSRIWLKNFYSVPLKLSEILGRKRLYPEDSTTGKRIFFRARKSLIPDICAKNTE